MKKMMIALAAIAMAIGAQAAAVGWTCGGASAFAGGSYDLFVIGMNGVTSVDQIRSLAIEKGIAALSDYAFAQAPAAIGSNGAISVAAAASGKSITYKEGGSVADNTYQAFLFVWDADEKNASFTATASTTLANNSTGKTFGFANQSANFAANSFQVVPEPTSGLLLLLGMAGLALKRKRA